MNVSRRFLIWAGGLLCAAGCLFVVFRLRQYWRQVDLHNFGPFAWLALMSLALCYGGANVFLARAWWRLLTVMNSNATRQPELSWAVRTYGTTQIAKYVPGNIAQFASRQVIAVDAGVTGSAVAMSAVWEMATLSLVALLFAVLAAPLFLSNVSTAGSLMIFVVALGIATLEVFRRCGRTVMCALLEYASFLAVAGMVFSGALALTAQSLDWELIPLTCGAYALAWVVGLLTPGAPAGAGVREAALLFLLNGRVAPGELVVAVVLGRIAMIVGDAAFFGVSALVRSRI